MTLRREQGPGLPKDAQERKDTPIVRGVLDYFPDAIAEVARVSRVANEQHNPGEPMHWAKEKSTDEADALVRHLLERGGFDTDGLRHSAKVAWRGLALLQREIEAEAKDTRVVYADSAWEGTVTTAPSDQPSGVSERMTGRICDCHKCGRDR
jgi:hypothetical protein